MGTPVDYSSVKSPMSPGTLVRSSTASAATVSGGASGHSTVGRRRRSLSLNLKTVMIEEFPTSARKDGSFANFKILQDKNVTGLNNSGGDVDAHLKHERRKSSALFQKLVGEESSASDSAAASRRHSVATGLRSVSNKENSGVVLPTPPTSSPLKEISLANRAEFKLFSQVEGHGESANGDDAKDRNNDNAKDNNNGVDYRSASSSPVNLKIKMNSPNPFVTPSKHLHSHSHDDDSDVLDDPASPVSLHVSNKQLKYVPLPLDSLKEKIEKFTKEKNMLLSLEKASKVEVGEDIDAVVEESQKKQKSAFSSGSASPTNCATVIPDSSPLKDYNLDQEQQTTASTSAATSTASSKRSSMIPLPTRIESRLGLLRSLTTLGDPHYPDDQYNYDPLNPTHRRKSVPASFPHYSTTTYPPVSLSNNSNNNGSAIPSRLEQLGSSLASQNGTKPPLPSGIPRSAGGPRGSGITRFAISAPASSRSSVMYGNNPNRRTYGSNRSSVLSNSSSNRSSRVTGGGVDNGSDFYPNHARSGSSLLDSERAKKSTYGNLYGRSHRRTGSHTGATGSSFSAGAVSSYGSVGGRPKSSTSARISSSPPSKLAAPTSINVIKSRVRDRSSRSSLASRNGIVPLTTFEVDGKTVIRGGGAVRSDRMRSVSG
ncbi:unnamed protein product [Ambrosiozyma monospora]|uniref:Unnamed protein product n=1 Tax=Ambrosiozyma monospora TaxID=43982 RepID=A0ACB5T6M7_AMBMO|nr:unnamed protein product [Ambrosiozyma monospora]